MAAVCKLPTADSVFFATLHMTWYSTQMFSTPADNQLAGVDSGDSAENQQTFSQVDASFSPVSTPLQPEFLASTKLAAADHAGNALGL